MKISKSWTSMIEVMVVLLIITMSIIWTFKIFSVSSKLSTHIKNKIEAIQIAREWIEAFTNIRNTNWILFSADYANCWNVKQYKKECIWNGTATYDLVPWSYMIYENNVNRWIAWKKNTWTYSDSDYRDIFRVYLESDTGLYSQRPGFWYPLTNFKELSPIFTRELVVEYIEDTNLDGVIDSNDEKMKVTSIVQWADSSSSKPHKVELETVLSNWRNKK